MARPAPTRRVRWANTCFCAWGRFKMKRHTVKEFLSPDRKRRVVIFQREDGEFSFREDRRLESASSEQWGPLWTPAPICDTEEAAEDAARAEVEWLRDICSR